MLSAEETKQQTESIAFRFLKTGELSDCTFVVRQGTQIEKFRCHKFALCKSSEVFQAMFLGEMKEKEEVKVTDIAPEIFRTLLKFIYTDELQLDNVEMALQVMMAANKYLLASLVDTCAEFIIRKMTVGDVCTVVEAALLIHHQQLYQACIKMIQETTEEILNASSWVKAPCASVITIVQQDTLNVVSELCLIAACERWVRHQVADVRMAETLASLKLHLRVRALNAEQFVEATVEDCIFSEQEFRQILGCIVRPELKLPEGICELTYPRLVPDIDEIDINAIINYMSNKNDLSLDLTVSSAQDASEFSPLIVFTEAYHALVYGVCYDPITSDSLDILDIISSLKKYNEDMSVELIDKQTRTCVTSLHFKGKVEYDSDVRDLLFSQPYLVRKGTQLELRVTYHKRVKGHRTIYVGSTPFVNEQLTEYPLLYAQKGTVAFGIQCIIYKIAK